MVLTESTQTFHYDDVVAISSRTVSDSIATKESMKIQFDNGSGYYATTAVNDRFSLSLVSGERVEVGVGISGPTYDDSELEIAWANNQVQRVVQRMVWSRKERKSEVS